MMAPSIISFGLALCLSVAHATPKADYVLHEKRSNPNRAGLRLSSSAVLPVRIGLVQQNLERGQDWLLDIADPSSTNFGKFWTEQDVTDAFAPAVDTADAVIAWLEDHNISKDRVSQSLNQGWLAFDATRHEAERLFSTEFFEYEDKDTGRSTVACHEYYLPAHLSKHIDYVKPGVMPSPYKKRTLSKAKRQFRSSPHGWTGPLQGPWPPLPAPGQWGPPQWPGSHWNNSLPADLQNCVYNITPPCLKAIYSIPDASEQVSSNNSLGIYEEGDTYAQADLDSYFAMFLPSIPSGTHPTPAFIDGAVAPVPVDEAGGESELDLTIAYSLLYPQTITLYQTDDPIYAEESLNGTYNGFMDNFLDAVDGSFCNYSAYGQTGNNNTLDPPYPDPNPGGYKGNLQCGVYQLTNVLSVSYLDSEAGLPVNYQKRQCNEYMKLALQGHTILFASGDNGVASFGNQTYPNGTCLGDSNQIFEPAGPSTCPWVTAVGATQIPANGTVYSREVAALRTLPGGTVFSSGGGFSNIFPIPSYQASAVAEYFRVQNPPYAYYETTDAENIGANGGIYNRIGRGYPDISALGSWWLDYTEGQLGQTGGTSMATPIVASVINRIVEERIKVGKGPIGFLNTHIYANPWLLNDVVEGRNYGCQSDGFEAARGWDPITGVGTPNYPRLLEYFLRLP